MGGGLDALGVDGGQRLEVVEDVGELEGEAIDLGVGQPETGEPADVHDLVAGDGHGAIVHTVLHTCPQGAVLLGSKVMRRPAHPSLVIPFDTPAGCASSHV